MTDPLTMAPSPVAPSTWVSTPNPTAPTTSPAPIRDHGRTRRASTGTTMEPTMNAAIEGTVASPAFNGERPSTSCRYCAMKMYAPNTRSEEHTSELQSHHDLVCRLLLEKKK